MIHNAYLLLLLRALMLKKVSGMINPNLTFSKNDANNINITVKQISTNSLIKNFTTFENSRYNIKTIVLNDYCEYIGYETWANFVKKEENEFSKSLKKDTQQQEQPFWVFDKPEQEAILSLVFKRVDEIEKSKNPFPKPEIDVARNFFELAISEEVKNNLVKAKELYLQSSLKEPKNADFLIRMASIEHRLGNIQQAVFEFEKTINLCQEQENDILRCIAQNNLALCFIDVREFEKARTILANTLEISLQNPFSIDEKGLANIHTNLGIAEMYLKNTDKAIHHLKTALLSDLAKNTKNDILAIRHSNLGLAYQQKGNFEKAEKHLTQALDLDLLTYEPSHQIVALSIFNLVVLFQQTERNEQALQILEKYFEKIDITQTFANQTILKNYSILAETYLQTENWLQAKITFDNLYKKIDLATDRDKITLEIIKNRLEFIDKQLSNG